MSSEIKVMTNTEVSMKQVNEVLAMLPDAVVEVFPDVEYEPLKAAHLITGVVSGQSPWGYFAVAMMDDVVVGFLGGTLNMYAFSTDKLAQDIISYVRPSARGSRAYVAMAQDFAKWAEQLGAKEVRGILTHPDTAEKIASASKHYGYERAGIVISKKLQLDKE